MLRQITFVLTALLRKSENSEALGGFPLRPRGAREGW